MPETRPNLLLITSDQQRYLTLGATNPKIKTPNLDRLAARGVRFERAYCPNPTCTPTRASILTGVWPSVHGAYTLGTALPRHIPTVGDHLLQAGYSTFLVGKAHFEPLAETDDVPSEESYPRLRDLDYWRTFNGDKTPYFGFDHVELARNHTDEGHVGQHYAIWLEEKGLDNWRAYFQPRTDGVRDTPDDATLAPQVDHRGVGWRSDMSWKLPAELHYTTWTAERTNALIEERVAAGTPFFCWSSYHDPHPPYAVPEPWASMYDPADMEDQIGHFVDGEFDDMPPIYAMTRDDDADFSSFNPDVKGSHGVHAHFTGKSELKHEDLLRACAAYYGMISFMDHAIGTTLDTLDRLGQTDNTLIVFTTDHGHFLGQHGLIAKGPFHYEDLIRVPMIAAWPGHIPQGEVSHGLQTLVDLPSTFLAAAGQQVPFNMQGLDMTDAWANHTGRDWVIVENHHNGDAVHVRTLVTDRYKLNLWRGRPTWGELFDLQGDPGELTNLFNRDPTLRADMMQQFMQAELEREATLCRRISGA